MTLIFLYLGGEADFVGNTWVHPLFEGLLTNETKCITCENVTSRDETFLDVSVDINNNSSVTNCLAKFAEWRDGFVTITSFSVIIVGRPSGS